MDKSASKKTFWKIALLLLKVTILLLLSLSIFRQYLVGEWESLWAETVLNSQKSSILYPAISLLLLVPNVALEALKWQKLLKGIQDIGFFDAFKAVLAGITIGMFTPNRVGETAGRLALLSPGNRLVGLGLGFTSSLSQLLASFSIGFLGSLSFVYFTQSHNWLKLLIPIGLFIVALLSLSYFKLDYMRRFLVKFPILNKEKFRTSINLVANLQIEKLSAVLFLSATRHLLFSFQLFLLFRFFGGEESTLLIMSLILTAFFLQTVLPSIALIELGVRSSVMMMLCGMIGVNAIAGIMSTFGLWVINLLIPSVLGMFYWWTFKWDE